jgi:hypothetical protein
MFRIAMESEGALDWGIFCFKGRIQHEKVNEFFVRNGLKTSDFWKF